MIEPTSWMRCANIALEALEALDVIRAEMHRAAGFDGGDLLIDGTIAQLKSLAVAMHSAHLAHRPFPLGGADDSPPEHKPTGARQGAAPPSTTMSGVFRRAVPADDFKQSQKPLVEAALMDGAKRAARLFRDRSTLIITYQRSDTLLASGSIQINVAFLAESKRTGG